MARFSRGFTLIELLVVIAIIGILSSTVLSALNDARARGKDASIKSQMAQMRPQAELFYSIYGSYRGTGAGGGEDNIDECLWRSNGSFTTKFVGTVLDPNLAENINALGLNAVANRDTSVSGRVYCGVDATRWAFAVPLNRPASGTNGWCVDSAGSAKAVQMDFTLANNSLFSCP